jgi:hypothetical protein
MNVSWLRHVLPWLVPALFVCVPSAGETPVAQERPGPVAPAPGKEQGMKTHYLEIVTPDVEATCTALETLHGVRFSEPDAALGNARTVALDGGGRIGVRAPMRETEQPVVRPYVLVDNIEAAVKAARTAGAEIALPSTEIPGRGRFAIYFLGGIEHGLWQL